MAAFTPSSRTSRSAAASSRAARGRPVAPVPRWMSAVPLASRRCRTAELGGGEAINAEVDRPAGHVALALALVLLPGSAAAITRASASAMGRPDTANQSLAASAVRRRCRPRDVVAVRHVPRPGGTPSRAWSLWRRRYRPRHPRRHSRRHARRHRRTPHSRALQRAAPADGAPALRRIGRLITSRVGVPAPTLAGQLVVDLDGSAGAVHLVLAEDQPSSGRESLATVRGPWRACARPPPRSPWPRAPHDVEDAVAAVHQRVDAARMRGSWRATSGSSPRPPPG